VSAPPTDKLRALLARGNWEEVAPLLQKLDPAVAADALTSLPFAQQETLFGKLPVEFAARLLPVFPYYHAYVLLHTRPPEEMNAILDHMTAAERLNFLEELPEKALQELMDEVSGKAAPEEAPPPEEVEVPELPPPPAIIQARRVEKSYERPGGARVQVIAPTDLNVEPGAILALLGPSGSGKSTLLRMLTGLSTPTSGEVLWHRKPLREADPSVAIVFQSFALFPWLTVVENVEVPLLARGMEPGARYRKALKALDSVGLTGFESAYPKELSGGMKQRVGFARALVVEPEVLFMDEPFSALDVLTAENLRGELLELWQAKRIPTRSIFLVTHNIEEAVLMADRIIVLGRNPAKIRADFRVPLDHPRERTSAEFLLYVDYIYKLMTQPELQAGPPSMPGRSAKPQYQMLPHARQGGIGGLLELLNDRGGKDDLYRIADELQMEVDDLLPQVEAATLLGFLKAEKGDLELTPSGKDFAEADISTRRQLFRGAALNAVVLLQQMHNALANKADHSMPLEFFRDILEEHFSEDEVQRQIDTALNWGRYGDIFTYDSETDRLQQHDPDREEAEKSAAEEESRT